MSALCIMGNKKKIKIKKNSLPAILATLQDVRVQTNTRRKTDARAMHRPTICFAPHFIWGHFPDHQICFRPAAVTQSGHLISKWSDPICRHSTIWKTFWGILERYTKPCKWTVCQSLPSIGEHTTTKERCPTTKPSFWLLSSCWQTGQWIDKTLL